MIKNPEKIFSIRIITVVLFLVLAIAGIGFSMYLIYISNTLYMYILSVAFTILAVVAGVFNIFASTSYYRSYFYNEHLNKIRSKAKMPKVLPTVGIIMPVYNEDPSIVEKNLLRLKELKYNKDKLKIYLSDNSTDERIYSTLASFCKKNGIIYVHRTERKGFKAGTLNNALKHCNDELIAIFDYDEYITDLNFLNDLVPYFSDEKLAYIQTEKTYFNSKTLFGQSVSLFDKFFFNFIQPSRALNNTAIFAGSCGLIRKSVIDRNGGFPEYVIEDTFFSFLSDVEGYKSIYIPKVYARGKPVRSFTELARQQWRYNYGDTQFLGFFYKNKEKKRLSFFSHMDYITHGFGLNYISVILVLFTLVSVLIVFSPIHFISLTSAQFFSPSYIGLDLEVFGSIAFILSLVAPIIITKIYFNSIRKGIMIFLLNFSLAIIRTKAAVAAILNSSPASKWNRQKKVNRNNIIFAISNTKIELSISIGLVLLGIVAAYNKNIFGGIWLMWYATLYMVTTVLFYKYG